MTDSWKCQLSFVDRLEAINTMADCLVSVDPTTERSDHLKIAQQEHSQCVERATSKTEYNEIWSTKLIQLQKTNHSDHSKHPEPPHVPAVQKSCIGLYSDATPISSGLFSTIYRAPIAGKQNEPASIVALKVTNVANMSMPHDCFEEARLLKVVGGHSNILSIVDTFMLSASYFVSVSPFLPSTLDYLMEDGAITAKLTVEIISGIFSGLSHIHSLGILHRDIKPSNIFYDTCSRNAVIGDFGIAWCNDKTSEPSQQKCTDVGTTCYRAPELLFGYTAYGEGVDIWATGCVLAQCLHPEHKCIFDAGDLGSELRLISSIFQTLGTPTTETWPESSQFPDFGKITFVSYPPKPWDKLLPSVESSAVDLLSKLLTYESQDRLSAVEALKHWYLDPSRSNVH